MSKYRATDYLRLSYTENHENESDSIANQKKLIEDYVKEHPDIELVSEKVDDGYSGILFDRPAFQEMMQDIMEGKINCVIVKDLSRLGREYIETGRYLRRIFPAYGVRFIAINDNIDTAHEHAGDDLNISMKNLINDAYCYDISVKTRSALDVKRKKGDYVGACPVYGYRKSEENRNQLVIDEYAARVVRDIFRAKIDGRSAKRIADELNALGVLSPLTYKISRGLPHPKGGFADRPDAKWSATTVIRILQDEIYTGTLVQGRQGTYNHKLRNVIQKPEEEWIRVENAHEAIILKRDFDLVQHIMGLDTRTAPEGEKVYLFSGLLVCGCCGARMTRKTNTMGGKKYIYYHCPTGKKHGCTHPVMLREDDLIQCVLASVQAHIKNVVSVDELLNSISEETINRELVAGCKAQIAENRAQLEQIGVFKAGLYENFVKGMLDKAEYKSLRDGYTERMEELRSAIDQLRQEMERVTDRTSERQKWAQQFREFSNMTELDRRAVVTLIQSIRIISKAEIKITFRYQMEYDAALQKLSQAQLEREAA
ncbi:MAG: recombinase family protein [Methanocorpusculum sp.]|nr:recombinase family protein [Methanocorpusculum sp.]